MKDLTVSSTTMDEDANKEVCALDLDSNTTLVGRGRRPRVSDSRPQFSLSKMTHQLCTLLLFHP